MLDPSGYQYEARPQIVDCRTPSAVTIMNTAAWRIVELATIWCSLVGICPSCTGSNIVVSSEPETTWPRRNYQQSLRRQVSSFRQTKTRRNSIERLQRRNQVLHKDLRLSSPSPCKKRIAHCDHCKGAGKRQVLTQYPATDDLTPIQTRNRKTPKRLPQSAASPIPEPHFQACYSWRDSFPRQKSGASWRDNNLCCRDSGCYAVTVP